MTLAGESTAEAKRLRWARVIVGAGFLAGVAYSHELWFPVAREFPRAPVWFASPVWIDRALAAALAAALGLALSTGRKFPVAAAVVAFAALAFFDQTRLQPWAYEYALIFAALALGSGGEDGGEARTLAHVQILIASLYVWSGTQKLNYTFAHETLPKLLENFVSTGAWPLGALGVAVAASEIALGLGLLVRRTRRAAVVLAVAMHLAILVLLVAQDYNRIVWLWNAALIALVAAAFWGCRQTVTAAWRRAHDRRSAAGKAIVAAAVALPALSFFGLWDAYLAGALYSGNTETAVIRTNESLLAGLPARARAVVIETKNGEKWLPLFEWALADVNVPAYPARRVSRAVAREVCRMAAEQSGVELIVRERPAIFDGRYEVARISCAGL